MALKLTRARTESDMPPVDRLDPAGIVTDRHGNKYSIPPDLRDQYRDAYDAREIAILPDGTMIAIPQVRRDELRLTDNEVAAVKAAAEQVETMAFEMGLEDPGQFYGGVC